MPAKTINFAARCEYLSAIELHWPEVMKSLRLDGFPVYRACLKANAPGTALQTPLVLVRTLSSRCLTPTWVRTRILAANCRVNVQFASLRCEIWRRNRWASTWKVTRKAQSLR